MYFFVNTGRKEISYTLAQITIQAGRKRQISKRSDKYSHAHKQPHEDSDFGWKCIQNRVFIRYKCTNRSELVTPSPGRRHHLSTFIRLIYHFNYLRNIFNMTKSIKIHSKKCVQCLFYIAHTANRLLNGDTLFVYRTRLGFTLLQYTTAKHFLVSCLQVFCVFGSSSDITTIFFWYDKTLITS